MKRKIRGILIGLLALVSIIVLSMPFILAIDWSGEIDTFFESGGAEVSCKIIGNTALWEYGTYTLEAMNNCRFETTECCPSNYYCDSSGKCQPKLVINSCADYTSLGKSVCENEYDAVIIKDAIETFVHTRIPEAGDFCDSAYKYEAGGECAWISGPCKCKWDSANNLCVNHFPTVECEDQGPGNVRTCVTEVLRVEDKCASNGEYTIYYKAKLVDSNGTLLNINDPLCKDSSRVISCSEGERSYIPFFSLMNLVLSLSMVIVVYLFLKRK